MTPGPWHHNIAEEYSEIKCHNAESMLIDCRYALRQLRDHQCIARAVDALERIEEGLTVLANDETNQRLKGGHDDPQ